LLATLIYSKITELILVVCKGVKSCAAYNGGSTYAVRGEVGGRQLAYRPTESTQPRLVLGSFVRFSLVLRDHANDVISVSANRKYIRR